jgi:hypothetical protein
MRIILTITTTKNLNKFEKYFEKKYLFMYFSTYISITYLISFNLRSGATTCK